LSRRHAARLPALDEKTAMNNLLFDRLRPIGFTAAAADAFDATGIDGAWPARVTEVQRESVTLDDGATAVSARLHPQLERRVADVADAIAVGDWIAATRDGHGDAWVRALLPAATRIVRIDSDGRRRVLVANVDAALIVMGLDGDFNPRRVERYLALAQGAVFFLELPDRRNEVVDAPLEALQFRIYGRPCAGFTHAGHYRLGPAGNQLKRLGRDARCYDMFDAFPGGLRRRRAGAPRRRVRRPPVRGARLPLRRPVPAARLLPCGLARGDPAGGRSRIDG
jgi:hypothetical protein